VGAPGAIVVPANRGIGGSEPWFRINHQGHHFSGFAKMVPSGKGASQEVQNYRLTRHACHLKGKGSTPDSFSLSENE
jgi:hypothetical protein